MIKLQVIGNIGQDARISEVNGSKSINFSLAHNRKFADKDGVMIEKTTWVNCTFWRRDGASVEIAKYLTAGTKVFAEGLPETQMYQGKDGRMQSSLNLNVTMVELVGGNPVKEVPAEPEPVATGKQKPTPIL